ncbi:Puromycin-Sensitive Aminopeptidase [Manis pentadactyla]|nr:Puromycin-Sensitive Aminopeptidase [Manis pentadactyla]
MNPEFEKTEFRITSERDHWFYKDGSVITYFEIVNSFGKPTTQEEMDGWIGEVHKPMGSRWDWNPVPGQAGVEGDNFSYPWSFEGEEEIGTKLGWKRGSYRELGGPKKHRAGTPAPAGEELSRENSWIQSLFLGLSFLSIKVSMNRVGNGTELEPLLGKSQGWGACHSLAKAALVSTTLTEKGREHLVAPAAPDAPLCSEIQAQRFLLGCKCLWEDCQVLPSPSERLAHVSMRACLETEE